MEGFWVMLLSGLLQVHGTVSHCIGNLAGYTTMRSLGGVFTSRMKKLMGFRKTGRVVRVLCFGLFNLV